MNSIDESQPDNQNDKKEISRPEFYWTEGQLKSTIMFLAVPGILLGLILGLGIHLPKLVLYGVAGIYGLLIFTKSLTDPERLMAAFILYMPLSKQIVVPILPGINGTNMLIMMLIFSLFVISRREERPMFGKMPNTKLVFIWAILSSFSVVTLIMSPGGLGYLLDDVLPQYKGWLDQFFVFFLFLNLIRDGKMARRIIVYLMLGTAIGVALGAQEMIEKMSYASIEKSRVLGPQLQPNDFGAFIVYNIGPFLAIFLLYYRNWRTWVLIPYFAVTVKVLLSTFSRGAYLAFGLAAFVIGYVRGKWFLVIGIAMGVVVLITLPQLIPSSLLDRMGQTQEGQIEEEKLDASSEARLILWKAAYVMTMESPVFGKGFKNFRRLKNDYTDEYVREGDTHNMYFWISSQMGIPALIAFLIIILKLYLQSAKIYRKHPEKFARAIGLGGAATAGGMSVINMFGSRMIGIDVSGYIWIYFAVITHLMMELEKLALEKEFSK